MIPHRLCMIVHSYVSSCTPILDDPLNTLASQGRSGLVYKNVVVT